MLPAYGTAWTPASGQRRKLRRAPRSHLWCRAPVVVATLFGHPPSVVADMAGPQACQMLQVEAGFGASGKYVATTMHGGRAQYKGPGSAVLRYERVEDGENDAPCARGMLRAAGWCIWAVGDYRYGLATTALAQKLYKLGETPWQRHSGGETPITVTCDSCVDVPYWTNGIDCEADGAGEEQGCEAEGWTCKAYALQSWCSDGRPAHGMDSKFGEAFNYPERNCCVCGGRWRPSMDSVRQKLAETQKSVGYLEKSIKDMRSRLASAEVDLIKNAGRALEVFSGLHRDEALTSENEFKLRNLTQDSRTWAFEIKSKGDDARNMTLFANSLKNATAKEAAKAPTPKVLAHLDKLNAMIKSSTDFEGGPKTILYSEKRVGKLELGANHFRDGLGKRVRDVVASRLRREVDDVRRSFRRLRGRDHEKPCHADPFTLDEMTTEALAEQ
eukprot:CAMPEP_0117551064 /NCGR_PEP_ID=MMETSP0784-20121206/48999_1 /TAXON_ID=39447 /ORGANISM="" /LENGTH=442 /DNA_ID=CAMNT_0005348093 /DNA_START=1 /DNA_END=1329 /DNA_ORIENTATION=-